MQCRALHNAQQEEIRQVFVQRECPVQCGNCKLFIVTVRQCAQLLNAITDSDGPSLKPPVKTQHKMLLLIRPLF